MDRVGIAELRELEETLLSLREHRPQLTQTISQIEKRIADIVREEVQRRPSGLYYMLEPPARFLKTALQMTVGVVATALLVRTLWRVKDDGQADNLPLTESTLQVIAAALAIAAAVELAYTLFTEGPDEAINPLTLGLSAAVLIQLATVDTFHLGEGLALLFYTIGLVVLFYVRNRLVVESPDPADRLDRVKLAWARRLSWFWDRGNRWARFESALLRPWRIDVQRDQALGLDTQGRSDVKGGVHGGVRTAPITSAAWRVDRLMARQRHSRRPRGDQLSITRVAGARRSCFPKP